VAVFTGANGPPFPGNGGQCEPQPGAGPQMLFPEQIVLFMDILGFSYLTEIAVTGPYHLAPPMFPTDRLDQALR
jgi:hypothetical protein